MSDTWTLFSDTQKSALSAKLDPKHVKEREQGGRKLSYIEGWVAISEANRIFGYDGWERETVELKETSRDLVRVKGYNGKPDYDQWRVSYIAKVRVTVGRTIVREGTGYGAGQSKPEDLGAAIESAVKEAETDAMKRAMMTFGNPFGLALYDKTQANVGIEDHPRQTGTRPNGTKSSAQIKREADLPDGWNNFVREIGEAGTISALDKLRLEWSRIAVKDGWNQTVMDAAKEVVEQQREYILNGVDRTSNLHMAG